MTDLDKVELAVRRTRDRIRAMPAYHLDVIQALDFLADEVARIGRSDGECVDQEKAK